MMELLRGFFERINYDNVRQELTQEKHDRPRTTPGRVAQ